MTWRITTEEVRDVVCANQAGQPPLPTPPRLTFLSQDDRFQVPNNRIPACAPSLHVHVWRFFAVLFTVSQRTGFCPCLAPTCVRLQLQTFRFCLRRTFPNLCRTLNNKCDHFPGYRRGAFGLCLDQEVKITHTQNWPSSCPTVTRLQFFLPELLPPEDLKGTGKTTVSWDLPKQNVMRTTGIHWLTVSPGPDEPKRQSVCLPTSCCRHFL